MPNKPAEPSPEVAPMQEPRYYYECQEKAFAPGIGDGWPKVIPAPHSKNARLVRRECVPAVAPRETQTEEFELFLRTAARSELVEYIRSLERGR